MMSKNKKKSPGRPKKEFVSKKPKTKIQDWPGRPRKHDRPHKTEAQVTPEVSSFVANSVDESKKKDLIILLLFILSFGLFLASIYFTFIRDKKEKDLWPSEIAQITNIDTGNIDYTDTSVQTPPTENVNPSPAAVQPTVQNLSAEQQIIVNFYQAVNGIDTATLNAMTDAHLKTSNVFITYFSKNRLSKFSAIITAPKVVVTNIQETTNTANPNIKNFDYTLEYMLASNNQKYTEERSAVLIKKGEERKIWQIMCQTKWCSTMPFFNPDKYKNN